MRHVLNERVSHALAGSAARWRISARIGDRVVFARLGSERVRAASTIKLAILLACLSAAERGAMSIGETLEVGSARVGGSGSLGLTPGVRALSVDELLSLMIALSDNTATNVLIGRVGFDAVNETARTAGAVDTELRRFLMDDKAQAEGRENWTTASDQTTLLHALTRSGAVLSGESTAYARELLAAQQFNDRMPELLPPGHTVLHKTGELEGLRHDVGVVVLPDGRELRIAVLGDGLGSGDETTGGQVIATVTRLLVDAVS